MIPQAYPLWLSVARDEWAGSVFAETVEETVDALKGSTFRVVGWSNPEGSGFVRSGPWPLVVGNGGSRGPDSPIRLLGMESAEGTSFLYGDSQRDAIDQAMRLLYPSTPSTRWRSHLTESLD